MPDGETTEPIVSIIIPVCDYETLVDCYLAMIGV